MSPSTSTCSEKNAKTVGGRVTKGVRVFHTQKLTETEGNNVNVDVGSRSSNK